MSRPLSVLLVATLFLSGVAIGALGMHLYYFERLHRPWEGPPHGAIHGLLHRLGPGSSAEAPPGTPPGTPFLGRWMARELELSPEQQRQIEEILSDSGRRAAAMRHELRPRVEALMEETAGRIAAVLTPEQRRRFERLRQRRLLDEGLLGPPGPHRHHFGRRPRHGQP